MPAPSDVLQFIRGQLFQTPQLPSTSFVGKTVVITGANTGLGFKCAKHLVQLNVSNLILGCRSIHKGEAAKEKLLAKSKNTNVQVWEVDMAKYDSVKSFAQKVNQKLPRMDAGLEETLTMNVVSSFLLCFLCLPKLRQTAAERREASHLIIVGSVVHCFADHEQIVRPKEGKLFSTLSDKSHADMEARYFISKLIVLLCVQEMSKQISRSRGKSGEAPVIFNCPNPGWCKTELLRQYNGGAFARNLLRLIGRSPEVGARTLTSALAADESTHGQYLSECQVKHASVWVRSQRGQNTQLREWKELIDRLDRI
ncbi:hypothetical protein M409DRAFT_64004 [Zasmidium cellare ATCC 36951]|uniref:Uncharacterized protein n=1 Tax=Zasmidium cellare ATCC 36951 TaxID=1080233 RepID=A0A6A6CYX2_ZASCE|nr:uncharacterized protein M409DRAFT_64004 [Zasmidium cellare ATCC 36951]KAF2171009.1 hypothetical protein M409DRAFT_64004 [Zasmidium cellare ATCC 36951]